MGQGIKRLIGSTLVANDGEIGKVDDVLFDDESWAVRYLVIETGGWLLGRKVLVSPVFFDRVDWEKPAMHVRLTRIQVEQSPDVSTDRPVTRNDEQRLFEYYGYQPYWAGVTTTGLGLYPGASASDGASGELAPSAVASAASPRDELRPPGNPHLRSTRDALGYRVQALDGELGHVDDFVVNADTFIIEGLTVDTSAWRLGRHLLVSPRAVAEVTPEHRTFEMRVARDALDGALA